MDLELGDELHDLGIGARDLRHTMVVQNDVAISSFCQGHSTYPPGKILYQTPGAARIGALMPSSSVLTSPSNPSKIPVTLRRKASRSRERRIPHPDRF